MKQQQKLINTLVLGYYGAKNLGDDMMLKAIILWLEKQGRKAIVVSEDPEDTHARFGVKTVANNAMFLQWGWVATVFKGHGIPLLRALWQCDELLVGGGDLIRDTRGWRFFWYTMEKILLAKIFSKPVFMVGVGIAQPSKKWSRFFLKYLLNKCHKIYVRDRKSLDLCHDLGVSQVQLMPDIATVLESHHRAQPVPQTSKQADTGQKYILVTLRYAPNVYGHFEIGEQHYINMAKALDLLIEQTGMKVIFNPYQENKDNLVHQEVVSHMRHRQSCTINEWNGDVMAAFALAANAEVVIGMRLHAVIIGVSANVRCIAMPYDYKIDEFCHLAGVSDKILPQDMLDVERMVEIVHHCLSKPPANEYMPASMWDEASLDR